MHRVASTGNAANPSRPRKERRLTYVFTDADDSTHSSGVNCVKVSSSSDLSDGKRSLFSGSRDGTLKRWEVDEEVATCCTTFESHVDWVNDLVLTGEDTLVSCSSDTTLKTWNAFSNGACTRTFRQHSDYVTSLAAARHTNTVASGGLGCEVFIWDLEAATAPVSKARSDGLEETRYDGMHKSSGNLLHSERSTAAITPAQTYAPIPAKGHKQSVYALAINDAGTVLVSGGTEKAVRVWDPRSGAKQMKLKGHTDNVRSLLLDPSGRLCLSGSSDSIIRLWDLGQQRCVHSYAVHTDSVWTMASTSSFSHVYSGGKDLSVYLTDLSSRESILLFTEQHPILQMALQDDDWLWVASTDSSIRKWPARERISAKALQKANSFVAGSLPFSRARAWIDGSAPAPLYTEPSSIIPGTPGIVKHALLNDKRHVLTKDTEDNVKLWEITRGAVVENYGKVSFDDKEKELFEMVSVPTWFTMDTRLGSISIHLDTPQCFSAEMYAVDLHVPGASEETKLNLGQETLRGLFAHWLSRRKQKTSTHLANGDALSSLRTLSDNAHDNTDSQVVFDFSTSIPPSIITEGSQGGPWRKKVSDLEGVEDEKELPRWCIDCVAHAQIPPREQSKCSFFLHPYEGTALQVLTQGKLSAPKILRIQKVINYVLEKLVLDRPLDDHASGPQMPGNVYDCRPSSRPWQFNPKPAIEILCNQQVLSPDMSLATVRTYIWKKPEDLCLYYRNIQTQNR
ncbi:hypothetical protein SELMODRAFT_180574 [Selaginella moellendorffii]|uniref:Uncharacterized protein n=1 Tax=Selaginella moellendorffii TaxID=88036 RepID=D8SKL4_SELML|nr:WD repeat-containing protein 48 [Selaginella moellendorffii]EFJ15001.1 hypothetical protein SELMODRAFT_180574 [Selaginella moellendorffii]|eukprot:XP_002983989.1 WD repeat-containing protein 48 [Selaginella moellendorffii]